MPEDNTPSPTSNSLINIDTTLLTMFYEDLARPGVQQVGKAIGAILELSNIALLSIKLRGDKRKILYTKHLEDFRKRLEETPESEIIEVAPELGVPIIEKLGKTTNERLVELYLNLLAAASIVNTAEFAHPRFVLLIESMAPDEAKLLEYLWRPQRRIHLPFIRVTAYQHLAEGESPDGRPVETVLRNTTVLETSDYLTFPKNTPMYLNNLIALGLMYTEDARMTVDKTDYDFLENHYQRDIQYAASCFALDHKLPVAHIITHMGYYDLTDLGLSFLRVCSPKDESGTSNDIVQ